MTVSVLHGLRVNKGSIVDDGANQHARILLTKRRTTVPDKTPTEIEKKLEAVEAELAKSKTEHEATKAELAKALAKPATPEDVEKSYPEAVRKALETERAARVELEKRLNAETEARETAEEIEKAKGYGAIGADPKALGPVLRKARKALSADEFKVLDTVLKASGEIAKASEQVLGKALGSTRSDGAESANEKLTTLAKARAATTKESFEVAYDEVAKQNPSLFRQAVKEGA